MPELFLPLNRRECLRAGLGAGAFGGFGWLRSLAASAPAKPAKSVVVLWLGGGPSTIDMWDLKPGHANGGPFKEIETPAPGLKIGEHLSRVAKFGKELAVLRSMSSREGDHNRATSYLRTGYLPAGPIHYPALGSLVAHEVGSEGAMLPSFVSIAPVRFTRELSGGFLGPKYAALVVGERPEGTTASPDGLTVPDLARQPGINDASQDARLEILAGLEKHFDAGRDSLVASAVRSANDRAARLVRPEAAGVFQMDDESDKTRDAYGRNPFGQGCLLARRLVEKGVSFVEVSLDGWDTHANNFDRTKVLCNTLDAGFGMLLADLKDRGLLDSTLVVCQGEFGRTPKINAAKGRDHWPAAWSVALAGGGIKGGQAVGKTTADGAAVDGTPTTVPDLIATVCKAVGIDPKKQNMSNVGRPIRVADPDAKPVLELL